MKTTLRSRSYLLLFAAALVLLLGAAPREMPKAGKFLVLRNGRTMEGDIDLVGDQYRVRRNGGETLVPANQVQRLFLDTEDAYRFLRARADLNDANERLRLAKWCLDYNLRERAEEEASVALVLRPNDAAAKRLLERIRQATITTAPLPTPTPTPPEPEPPAPVVELTPESMGQFGHKVQTILMNACASCHANGHGGSFKLTKVSDIPSLNRRATQENLAAVLNQINYGQPQLSPLLTKAISVHGGSEQAPLKGRQVVPYQTLEQWLRTTLATNPQLQERAGVAVVPAPAPLPEPKATFAESKPELPHPNSVSITPVPLPAPSMNPVVKPPEGGDDAYDPSEFNRQAHPERDLSPTPSFSTPLP
jgi:hypothetical protein